MTLWAVAIFLAYQHNLVVGAIVVGVFLLRMAWGAITTYPKRVEERTP